MGFGSKLHNTFWDEDFWLPKGIAWKDLVNTENKKFGQPEDLVVAIPLTVIIYCLRVFVEKYIFQPIGRRLGVSDKRNKPPAVNTLLDEIYKSVTKHPTRDQIQGYSKQLDWTEKRVARWFRKKNLAGRSSTLQKFSETGWRFTFYLTSFIYGVYVLYDQECIWNTVACWSDFPDSHFMTTKLYWYYLIELAFYTSTTATQFFDVKRKDFWEMFIHHIATILLLAGSYVMNFTKMGSFIIIVHDSADFYLEFAKMSKYAELKQTTNIAFTLFAIAFFLSRMMVLPFWILPAVWSGGVSMFLPFSIIHCLFPFLLTLQLLHFYWGYHVAGGVYSSIVKGKIERDTRSDTEDEPESDEDVRDEARKNGDPVASGDCHGKNGVHRRRN